MLQKFILFLEDRSGATAIEYTLLAALIGASLVFGMQLIGGAINGTLIEASNHMQ